MDGHSRQHCKLNLTHRAHHEAENRRRGTEQCGNNLCQEGRCCLQVLGVLALLLFLPLLACCRCYSP